MGAPANQPQQQQRGQMQPGQMGPPPPQQAPAQQQQGGSYFKDNRKGQFGQSLMMMGLNMLAQGPSENPVSFGSMLGQGALAGADTYESLVARKKREEEEERIRKRQETLDRRATITFKNQQKDRLRDQARQDKEDKKNEQRFQNEMVEFGHKVTSFEQNNILFENGQIDRGEKIRRDNFEFERLRREADEQDKQWERGDEQYARSQVVQSREDLEHERKLQQQAAMANPAILEGMNAEQRKMFGPMMPYMDPNVVAQYFSDVGEEEVVDMTTNDIKNAQYVAFSMNPTGTQAELDQAAAQLVQDKMVRPPTAINLTNSPGAKGNEDYSKRLLETAESSRNTLNLLNNFKMASDGVNTGYFGQNVIDTATGAGQLAKIMGFDDQWPQEQIDKMFQTDSGRASVLNAMGNRLALEMTNQLAGQISEKELDFSVAGMPSLLNTPKGNEMMITVLSARAEHEMARSAYVESLRDDNGSLPGQVKRMVAEWDKANTLDIQDANGALTPYGEKLLAVGMITVEDDGWKDED